MVSYSYRVLIQLGTSIKIQPYISLNRTNSVATMKMELIFPISNGILFNK